MEERKSIAHASAAASFGPVTRAFGRRKMQGMAKPPTQLHIFQDALICGMIGGTIAYMLGAPFNLWAMLCAIAGPLAIFATTLVLDALPVTLPYRASGAYEFALFALATAIAVQGWMLFG